MPVIEYTEKLQTCTCWCGIHLAVPTNLYRQAHELGKRGLYCPLGHQFFYGESELDQERKAREQAEVEANRAEQRRLAERDLRLDTEKRLRAQKAATTRAKRRAHAGVCPHCKRSFENVRRHIATKHADCDPDK